MSKFQDLETPIADLERLADLLTFLFEGIKPSKGGQITISSDLHKHMEFLVYEISSRTGLLNYDFQEAFKEDVAQRGLRPAA